MPSCGVQRFFKLLGILGLWLGIHAIIGCEANREKPEATDPAFVQFVREKEALARRLATKHGLKPRKVVWEFFAAEERGDWITSSNLFETIKKGSTRHGPEGWLPKELWGPIHDTYGAYEMFHTWHPQLLRRFGQDIIDSIPEGSIYFGGTDAGRFIVSALSKSHTSGSPFFTVTQNALADNNYLDYLRELYGTTISVPGLTEAQRAFSEYMADVTIRKQEKQLLEGEDFSIVGGKVEVRGETAVMLINERLVRIIMEMNRDRECYLEESYALKNLYSNSIPHGLIFKLNHQPLPRLSESMIEKDRRFWTEQVRALLGKSVNEITTVTGLCEWTENMHVRSNLAQFTGDRLYLMDKQAPQYFSQCRSAIAVLYQWRTEQNKPDAAVLLPEIDFAHRQAVALSPYNPVTADRYVDFLLQQQRTNDARALIRTILRLNPEKRMVIDSNPLKKALAKFRTRAKELGITESR